MIIILGLIILVAAIVAGVAGVLGNGGGAPGRAHGFSLLGYHVTGSGTRFLYGVAVGAIALFGLWLLLAGARRTARRGRDARRGLKQSRREPAAVTQDRDDLAGQRDTARAYTASNLGDDGAARNGSRPGVFARLFSRPATQAPPARGQEPAAVPAAVPQSAPLAVPAVPADGIGPADAGIPASASAPAE